MAYTKYSLTPANNNATPPDGAPEGMLPSAVNDTMRDMMAQIRDVGDGIRNGTYTMTAPVITGGSITGASGSFTSLTDSGNLTFTGTGNRITGDFSNATIANQVIFQTSTTNGNTTVYHIPNGTGNLTSVAATNSSDVSATSTGAVAFIQANATDGRLGVGRLSSSGSFLPLTMFVGGSERLRIDTSGNLGVGTSSPTQLLDVNGNIAITGTGRRITGDFSNATIANRVGFQSSTTNGNTDIQVIPNGTAVISGIRLNNNSDPTNAGYVRLSLNSTEANLSVDRNSVSGTYIPLGFNTGGSERLRIDTSGNVGIGTSSPSNFSGFTTLDVYNVTDGGMILARGSDVTMEMSAEDSGSAGNIGTRTNHSLVFRTNTTERMRITSGGNLLIGTTSDYSSNTRLNISNSTNAIITNIHNTGSTSTTRLANQLVRVASNASNADVCINLTDSVSRNYWFGGNNGGAYVVANSNGVRLADGGTSWASDSDERVKDIIEPITDAANKVSQLRSVIGKYKTDEEDKRRPFLIAQDVQAVLPEAVFDEQGTLMLAYTDTIPLLVAAIKEQQAMIEELKQEVAALKTK